MTDRGGDRRSRLAAQQSSREQRARRRRLLLAVGAVVVVVVVVTAIVLNGGGGGSPTAGTTAPLPTGGANTAEQQALLSKYDAPYQDAIPFIDYGNKFLSVGASYDPAVLSGLTWAQIAADLHDPSSPVAKSVLGVANYATAAVCALTRDQPASACTAVVRSLQSKV